MNSSYIIRKAWTAIALSGCVSLSMAATLTVPGTHADIATAMAAASSGDIIELTDNVNPYVGNVHVTKNNLTIQGQTGLSPAPLILGASAAHPLAGLAAGTTSERWYWVTGDATSRSSLFNTHGAAVINQSTGLSLKNLRISAETANAKAGAVSSGVLDFRFGSGGLVENCILDGTGVAAIGAERLVLTENAHTYRNVTFQNGAIPLEHSAGTGTIQIVDCLANGQTGTLFINGGTAVITGTSFDSSQATANGAGALVRNEFGPANATFTRCIFRKTTGGANYFLTQLGHQDGGAGRGADNYGTGRWSPATVEAAYDQCDFIGSGLVGSAFAINSGRSSWVVKKLRVTNCNFFNINGSPFATSDFVYPGNHYQAGGIVDRFEDYNVFKQAQNTAAAVGIVSGGNSITLAGEPLYADAAAANYQLASNSPAATLRGASTPAYTGSLGVSGVSVPVRRLTVGHTGADYTSINAAVAAAQDGDLIEITDNSAPYVEEVILNTRNGLTIRGAASLAPRPRIQPLATANSVVRLAANATPGTNPRNVTLANLVVDGTNISGSNPMTLDLRDQGETVVDNVHVIGGATDFSTVFAQYLRVMRNSVVNASSAGRPALQQNLSGNFALANSRVTTTGSGKGLILEGGFFGITNSFIRASGTQTIVIGFTGRSSYLNIRDSIITSDASGTPGSANNLITVLNPASASRRTVVIDNSDLVGSLAATGAGQSPTGSAIWVQGDLADPTKNFPITFLKVTDSIFHNTSVHAIYFTGNTGTATIPGLVFNPTLGVENYNAFKWSPETFSSQGITQGANDINLDNSPLYANAPASFGLNSASPATTLNSTGTPAYAGSKGIEPVPTAASDWALFQ